LWFAFAFALVALAAGLLAAALTALLTVLAAVAAWLAAALAAFAAALAAFATWFIALAMDLLAFTAVLLLAASPQAIPKAPSAKRVESAIIFLISKWTLLSFSKINLLIFTYYRPCERHCPRTVKFWNNRQYSHPAYISQLLKQRKTGFRQPVRMAENGRSAGPKNKEHRPLEPVPDLNPIVSVLRTSIRVGIRVRVRVHVA
jgi:hypothetical protein